MASRICAVPNCDETETRVVMSAGGTPIMSACDGHVEWAEEQHFEAMRRWIGHDPD